MKVKKPEFIEEWSRISKTDKKIFKSLPKRWRVTIYFMFFSVIAAFLLWVVAYIQIYTKI